MKLDRPRSRVSSCQEVSNAPQRVYALDGTRGLAVSLVFFVHYHALFSTYVLAGSISFAVSEFLEFIGHTGVDLFFVLSGYLIYGIVIQTSPRYSKFLWRRIKRIYPTFLCVLALYIALSFLFPSRSKLPSSWFEACVYVLRNVALLPGIYPSSPIMAVAWSLGYELAFYLSIPLLISMTGMRSWRGWQRIVLFLTLVLLYFGLSLAVFSGLQNRFLMFAVGILLREILNYDRVRDKLTGMGEKGAILFYSGSLALIYCARVHPWSENPSGIIYVFLTSAGSFAFGLYCFGFDGILNTVFSRTPIRRLGEISYSYYLIHGLTLNGVALVLTRWLPPSGSSPVLFWSVMPCAFAITLAAATTLFILVERPYSVRQTGVGASQQPSCLPSLAVVLPAADGVSVQQSAN